MATLIEKYQGVTPAKPYKYKPFSSGADLAKKTAASAPAQKQLDTLITDRNAFYAANRALTKAPKYTFTEAASLYGRGYSGVFGRAKSKQSVGLLGEGWQQAYALDALRKNKDMLDFMVLNTNVSSTAEELEGFKQAAAADQSAKTWTNLFTLYNSYQKMGGEAGYAKRYGKGLPPSATSKYGILNHLDNKAVRRDDVQATYQNNLAIQLESLGKSAANIAAEIAKDPNASQDNINAARSVAEFYAGIGKENRIAVNQKLGKPKQEDIKFMERTLADAPSAFSDLLQNAIGAKAPTRSQQAIAGAAATIVGGPLVAAITGATGKQDEVGKAVTSALDTIAAVGNLDALKAKPVDFSNPLSAGVGIAGNIVTGLTRFGVGFVPGAFMALDEGLIAANEARLAVTQGKKFGEGVDFELGDAMWSDFSQRYYDPFAYKASPDGEREFQGFREGFSTSDSWQMFGNKVAMDPITYTLDVLALVPVLGVAARGAALASLIKPLGRGRGFTSGVAAKVQAAKEVKTAAGVAAAAAAANLPKVRVADLTRKEKAEYRDARNVWRDEGTKKFEAERDDLIDSPEQLNAEAKVDAAIARGMDPNDPEFPTTPLNDLNERFANRTNIPEPMPIDFAKARLVLKAEESLNALRILEELNKDPDFISSLSKEQINKARAFIEDNKASRALSEADAELIAAHEAYKNAPSVRSFRRTARQAIAGVPLAIRQLAQWKAVGYEFNNAENNIFLNFAAKFEPRTKVLDAPPLNVNQSAISIVSLPGNPIARNLKTGALWVGKYLANKEAAAVIKGKAVEAKIIGVAIDLPFLGYRWNYTKAIQSALEADLGDVASEFRLAADNMDLYKNSNLSNSWNQAILSIVYGGTGITATNAPNLRFIAINNKLDSIMEEGKFTQEGGFADGKMTSTPILGTENQVEALIARRNAILNDEIGTIEERALSFDQTYHSYMVDIRYRMENPNYNRADKDLDEAVRHVRRMNHQYENISNRIVHTETNSNNIEALRYRYWEAMNGLMILPEHLFGKGAGSKGSIGEYADQVVNFNDSLIPHTAGLYGTDDASIIFTAQKAKGGTVFEDLAPGVRGELEADFVKFIKHITNPDSNAGLFRRGDSHPNSEASPVAVLDLDQKGVPAGFSRIHLPKLRSTIDGPNLSLGKIIDPNESFTIPNVLLETRIGKKGDRKVQRMDTTSGRDMLETGSLNAMSDVYPNARFYSEKVGENGLTGAISNESQAKGEHTIAASGLREHSKNTATRSMKYHYEARLLDSFIKQAEESAVFVRSELVVNKTPKQSGYRILKLIQAFDDLESARAFARLRGVEQAFDEGLLAGPQLVSAIVDAPQGLSRMIVDGKEQFIVRGTVNDWAKGAGAEDIGAHSIMSQYIKENYDDPYNTGTTGLTIAIPNSVDKRLSLMVIEGNHKANEILNSNFFTKPTTVFKYIVLNMRLGFIDANVIGGSAMMMMYTPMAAGKLVARLMAKNGIIGKDSAMANWAGDSAAVDRPMAWEVDHNVYRIDSGIGDNGARSLKDFSDKSKYIKKYIVNGGYTVVAAFERQVRNAVAVDFLTADPAFKAFMRGPEVNKYISDGIDYTGDIRGADNPISRFEAAADILLDRNSLMFNADLKHRMRYVTNTVAGNYHRFNAFETFMRGAVMPFYAWQRHSLAYTWRTAVNKPITANVQYKIGQQGFNQVAENGLEDYLRQTIPVPSVLKEHIGFLPKDFRIDASWINPFGATTSMTAALYNVITGTALGESIFQFGNPYLNNLIKDVLHVDPVTGRIDWASVNGENQNGAGIWDSTTGMFKQITKSTIIGSGMKVRDAVDNAYEQDSLADQYPAIESVEDALKILGNQMTTDAQGNPISQGLKGWSLSIPNQRWTKPPNRAMDLINAAGFKSHDLNMSSLNAQTRKEYVAALALAFYNNKKLADAAVSDMNSVSNWQAKQAYVNDVWVPRARAVGVGEATIQVVLMKLALEKPKGGKGIDPALLIATMGVE